MKIRIEIVDDLPEEEVVIRCKEVNNTIQGIQKAIIQRSSTTPKLIFYKKNEEYYFQLEKIYFFETSGENVYAHTADDVYRIKLRLYELDELLPKYFLRVSKSTILNIQQVLSINRNLTASSLVQFHKSHKQVYVSRMFYKTLREKLNERS